MGGTFEFYSEPEEHNVLKGIKESIPGNVTKSDLIRMGLSDAGADKAIEKFGYGGGNEPPGGYIGGGAGGGSGRHYLRYVQIHAAAPPDAKIDERVFDRMITAQTPMHLMAEIQRQLDHCRQQVIKPDQKPDQKRENLRNLEGKELEIDVALYFGRDLIDFGRKYNEAGEKLQRDCDSHPYTDVDVEASEFMIEVTNRKSKKDKQIRKYININNQEKCVILYAPKYNENSGRNLTERTGVQIARSKEELFELCQKLRLDSPT